MKIDFTWSTALVTILVTILGHIVVSFIRTYVWRPRKLWLRMKAQGITGPYPRILSGNLTEIGDMIVEQCSKDMDPNDHDYTPRIFPHIKAWSGKYGSRFLVWWGEEPGIIETDVDVVKEVFNSKYDGAFGKYSRLDATLGSVIGNGLAIVNGVEWLHRRTLTQPAYGHERLKGVIKPVIESALPMIQRWESISQSGSNTTVDAANDLISLASDILSRVAFKSNFEQVRTIFHLQLELMVIAFDSIAVSFIPGFKYFPTKSNLRRMKLHKEIDKSLRSLVRKKMAEEKKGRKVGPAADLMDLLLAANSDSENMSKGYAFSEQQLLDEVKASFAAGFDTVSSLMYWTMLLLAQHPEWQERCYAEIQEVCGHDPPESDSLNKLKVLTMVITESLRLYPPAPQLSRKAVKDVRVGNIDIPEGMSMFVPVAVIHRSKDLWGEDANEFKPERFERGLAAAMKHPVAWMPFGAGPRTCVAKPFALMEAKTVLTMIIQTFKFKLSETYRHGPVMVGVVMRTAHGLPIHLTKRDYSHSS